MDVKDKEYLKTDYNNMKIVKSEVFFAPMLIILPLLVGSFLVFDWFNRGYSLGVSDLNGQLMLGVIILVGNILFDIPFVSSLIRYKKDKRHFKV
ncbi:MAG: hypothetical protein QHH19_02810 [Candidatus Thermoplasmatota archaeon]|nr:hypothetical protein [Candidatus Thermoplasmatota archaeon]